jgi:hydroxymethylpyrimidine kinase/phosphomethylpyrimidine kinase
MSLSPGNNASRPNVVLVGGLDPGGGAGVLRDMRSADELGAHSLVVATCITEQDTTSVASVEPRDPGQVGRSLSAALARARPACVKVGMVANAGVARAIAHALSGFTGKVVYDPVLRASSGGSLYLGDQAPILGLARLAFVLTPNLGEAAWLLGRPVESVADALAAARDLVALGAPAVLVKGGHLAGDASDVLCWCDGLRVITHPRIAGPSPRGTGCALATAIAVGLARGQELESAVGTAKTWLASKIAGATRVGDEWQL